MLIIIVGPQISCFAISLIGLYIFRNSDYVMNLLTIINSLISNILLYMHRHSIGTYKDRLDLIYPTRILKNYYYSYVLNIRSSYLRNYI